MSTFALLFTEAKNLVRYKKEKLNKLAQIEDSLILQSSQNRLRESLMVMHSNILGQWHRQCERMGLHSLDIQSHDFSGIAKQIDSLHELSYLQQDLNEDKSLEVFSDTGSNISTWTIGGTTLDRKNQMETMKACERLSNNRLNFIFLSDESFYHLLQKSALGYVEKSNNINVLKPGRAESNEVKAPSFGVRKPSASPASSRAQTVVNLLNGQKGP